jgi:hypothetical protein
MSKLQAENGLEQLIILPVGLGDVGPLTGAVIFPVREFVRYAPTSSLAFSSGLA